MKYFLDTEFVDYGNAIVPISVGLVSEDGNTEFYSVCEEYLKYNLPDWHKQYVIPNLMPVNFTSKTYAILSKLDLTYRLKNFTENFLDKKPEFYGWYSAYDWVLVCQLFGGMLNLPKFWPRICYDFKAIINLNHPDVRLPNKTIDRHNALEDARWIRDSYVWYSKKYMSSGS